MQNLTKPVKGSAFIGTHCIDNKKPDQRETPKNLQEEKRSDFESKFLIAMNLNYDNNLLNEPQSSL